jgi:uncharacterized protein YdcH (DUF465 family)
MFYKTHKKYKRLHKCKRRALILDMVIKVGAGASSSPQQQHSDASLADEYNNITDEINNLVERYESLLNRASPSKSPSNRLSKTNMDKTIIAKYNKLDKKIKILDNSPRGYLAGEAYTKQKQAVIEYMQISIDFERYLQNLPLSPSPRKKNRKKSGYDFFAP